LIFISNSATSTCINIGGQLGAQDEWRWLKCVCLFTAYVPLLIALIFNIHTQCLMFMGHLILWVNSIFVVNISGLSYCWISNMNIKTTRSINSHDTSIFHQKLGKHWLNLCCAKVSSGLYKDPTKLMIVLVC
jgi:hypothetical protein